MDPHDRPKLPPTVYKSIESSQIKIDEYYWKRLQSFQVSVAASTVVRLGFPDLKPIPPEPKRPDALRSVITAYVRNLFFAEAARYPVDSSLENHLARLGVRITERVLRTITALEAAGNTGFRNASLAHHGLSIEQMRNTASDEIKALVEGQSAQIQSTLNAHADATSVEQVTSSPKALSEGSSEVERRAKLLSDYKAATGAKDYHIFTATNSGIHKPEFYQWKNGRLPDKSKVTKRFEAFLKAKKRPIRRNPTN
jgi:hypothetical protein